MTFIEAVIGIIAIALLIAVLVMTRLAGRIGRAADDVGLAARRVAELTPAARGVLETANAELASLHKFSSTAAGVADDVRSVTSQASAVASHVMQGFESQLVDRYRAIFMGARAGLGALRRFRGGNGYGADHADSNNFDFVER